MDIVRGIELARDDAGGRAGDFTIRYVSLDDATASSGEWDPGQVSANARKVVGDDRAIAYIGDFSSAATVISLPILNAAGIPMVSPSNTYAGLTRAEGAGEGEPDKYYPSGQRTYVRVVPADHIQAAAQVTYMRDKGCTGVYIEDDKDIYGAGLAAQVEKLANEQGLPVVANDGIDPEALQLRRLAGKVAEAGADCFLFSGTAENGAADVFNAVHAAAPRVKMFGPDRLVEPEFTTALGRDVEKQVSITHPTLVPELYPSSAQEFFADFERRYGRRPEPYAIYGYEAMKLLISAIERAGERGDDRAAVIEQLFQTKDRESVLGVYDIDENGDTTLTDYGAYRIDGGTLVFSQVIKVVRG